MTTEVLAQTLTAGVQATFPMGRIFYIKTATSALTIYAEKIGPGAQKIRKFVNMPAGAKFTASDGDGWTYLRVTSAVTQNVEIIVGDDDVEVANAVSVTGGVVTTMQPFTAVTDTVDNAQASGTQTVISANASRRRITIGVLSTSNNSIRVSKSGGAGRGEEIQPGQNADIDTIDALTVRNDNTFGTAAAATWWAEEFT